MAIDGAVMKEQVRSIIYGERKVMSASIYKGIKIFMEQSCLYGLYVSNIMPRL